MYTEVSDLHEFYVAKLRTREIGGRQCEADTVSDRHGDELGSLCGCGYVTTFHVYNLLVLFCTATFCKTHIIGNFTTYAEWTFWFG